MKKILLLLFTLFLFSACRTTDSNSILEMKKVRLGLSLQPSNTLVIIAHEKGFFKKHGLDIEVQEFPSGKKAIVNGLLKGEVDIVGSTTGVPFVLSLFEHNDITAVASVFAATNVNRIIARKDRGIKSPTDLINKKIGTQKASAVHYFLNLVLLKYDIDINDNEVIYLNAADLPQALYEGKIDAFSMREPYISQAKELLKENAVVFEEPGVYRQIENIVTTKQYIQNNSQIIVSFLRGVYDSKKFIDKHPDLGKEIIADKFNISLSSVEAFWSSSDFSISLSQSSLIMMENIARWALLNKLVMSNKMPNLLNNLYFDALHAINPNAVTVIH